MLFFVHFTLVAAFFTRLAACFSFVPVALLFVRAALFGVLPAALRADVAGDKKDAQPEQQRRRKRQKDNCNLAFHTSILPNDFRRAAAREEKAPKNQKSVSQPKTRSAIHISDCCHTNFQLIGKRDTKCLFRTYELY